MHHQYYQIQQQLLHHQSSSGHGFTVAGGGVSAPGSSVGERAGFLPTTVAPKITTVSHPPAISYRPIRPSDLKILQELHEALFPIKYELEFFSNVVHCHGIISWAAVDTNRSSENSDELVGFVTARVVAATESEEADMLGYELVSSERTLIYILTLGVIKQYRNLGIVESPSACYRYCLDYCTSSGAGGIWSRTTGRTEGHGEAQEAIAPRATRDESIPKAGVKHHLDAALASQTSQDLGKGDI